MPSHDRLADGVHRIAGVAAWISIVVGVAVVMGWLFDVHVLMSVGPGLPSMKANTAIGFVLAGGSLWLQRDEGAPRANRLMGAALGMVIAVVAALTLAEYVFGIDLALDHLFTDAGAQGSYPGRPSPHTALAFLAIGLWLATLGQPREVFHRIGDGLAVVATVIVLQAGIGYLYGVRYLYGVSGLTGMAVHTMATFVILCAGILAARPQRGFMGLLTSVDAGGHVARRLTPAVLLLPLLIGYVCLRAQLGGLFGTRDGVAIFAGSTVILVGGIVIFTGLSLNRADRERHRLEERLRELAERDPLTSLFNRRRFNEAIAHEVATAARRESNLALIMIDIDGLKQVNDSQGHHAGDQLILGVAKVLTDDLRATDTAARLGGDEFAVLLPDVDAGGARAVTSKLLDAMRLASWEVAGTMVSSTISAGIAVAHGPDPDPADLIDAADKALYRAKATGGNSYAVAPSQALSIPHSPQRPSR